MDLSALEACETRLRLGSTEPVDLPSLKGRSPEEQVAVLRVLRALHLRGDTIGVPAERETGRLPVEVRLELYTLQLSLDPTAFDLEDPLAAEALLRIRAGDVRPEAVRALAERGIEHGGPHLEHAFVLLDEHAGRGHPGPLLALADRLLDTRLAPLVVDRLVAFGADVPAYAALEGRHRSVAAVRAHGLRGERALLLRVAADADAHPAVRRTALTALGACARREDLPAVLALGVENATQLASAAVSALVDLRHRGCFVQADHLPALFELALSARTPLAGLTAHLRDERLAWLLEVDVDDPRLLVWLLAFDVPEPGLVPLFVRMLETGGFGARSMALDLLKRPDTTATGVQREALERALLAARTLHPVGSRRALEVHGGETTCATLLRELDAGDLPVSWLPVLIGLVPDGDPRLDALEQRVDIQHGGERLVYVPRGTAGVRLVHGMAALQVFLRLCETGSLLVLSDLVHLLQTQASALVDVENDWGRGPSRRPVLASPVVEAVRQLASAVRRRGGLETLLGQGGDQGTGLLRILIVRALEGDCSADVRGVLIRSVPLDGLSADHLVRWGRTKDPVLLRDVLERMGDHEDTVTLGPYVVRGLVDPDARVARAAARAVASMECRTAAPDLVRMLERPSMELKRVAARALAVVGDARAVPRLVHWIGHHDNGGFRQDLCEALDALLPGGVRGMLLAAAADATGRTSRLLHAAVASLDVEPTGPIRREVDHQPVQAPPPFLVRAEAFTREGTPQQLDALLAQPLHGLSEEAERVLGSLEERLFAVFRRVPAEEERAARGRGATHLLRWLARRPSPDRATRIRRLRDIATLPMGTARWDALLAHGALLTLGDLQQGMADCARAADGWRAMTTLLAATDLTEAEVHAVVHARDRAGLLAQLFEGRAVRPREQNTLSWPEVDLENAERAPEDWPWVPACWDEVVAAGGQRRPVAHEGLLRALFTRSIEQLEPTPDRLAWTAGWPERPTDVEAWSGRRATVEERVHGARRAPVSLEELLPRNDSPPVGARSFDVALRRLQTPGEERQGLRELAQFPGHRASEVVRPLLADRRLRAAALRCFRRVAHPQEVREVLRGMLDDRNDEWVRTCGRSLAYMRDPGSVRAFVGLLDHRSVPVRRMAVEALKLQPEEAEREVRRALRRARPDRRPVLHRLLSTLTSGAQRPSEAVEAG